jgi:hypothetical protein
VRRAALLSVAAALLLPAAAIAKTGLSFDTWPETSKVGHAIPFTMRIYKDPPASGGRAKPVAGIRPLVTFRSASGRVVRVRTHRTDRFGVAHGKVAFPDKGPWTLTYDIKVAGVFIGSEDAQPIHVGTGLTQTVPSADQERRAVGTRSESPGPGFPWAWVLSLASIGSALLVFGMRRRGRWGAA